MDTIKLHIVAIHMQRHIYVRRTIYIASQILYSLISLHIKWVAIASFVYL